MNVIDTVRSNNMRMLELLVAVPGQFVQDELNLGLLTAIKSGFTQCAQVLLEKTDADPDYHDKAGDVALVVYAAQGDNDDMLRLLLRAGADANVGQGSCGTPLHFAAKTNCVKCVQALIEFGGVDVNARDRHNNTPLIVATKAVAIPSMRLLMAAPGCKLDLGDASGRTALHYACHKSLADLVLLQAGASPDVVDEDKNSPIHMAATEGFDRVVLRLLEHGADPNVTNCFGKSAAHYLAMKNHCTALQAIAEAGGRLNIIDNDGNTPLMCAMQRNRVEAVKLLLVANCEHESSSITSTTAGLTKPLKFAFERRLFGMAKLMVLAGAELVPVYEWITSVEDARKRRAAEIAARPAYVDPAEEDEVDEEAEEELEEALEWFKDWLHKPHSLQQHCRMWIRQYIGTRMLTVKDDCLPVPSAMVDYITLKEVADQDVDSYLI